MDFPFNKTWITTVNLMISTYVLRTVLYYYYLFYLYHNTKLYLPYLYINPFVEIKNYFFKKFLKIKNKIYSINLKWRSLNEKKQVFEL